MTQMNLSTKQKERHREQTCSCQGGGVVVERWTGSLVSEDANYYRMDKQQGPTI